jgi:ActR/RegA family two-component response regulator
VMFETLRRSGLRRKSALVVDDNVNVQAALAKIAKAMGFDAMIAASRKEAFELIDRRAFDVAIVDMRLVEHDEKNRDGIAVLRHIKAKNEGTESILLTGYGKFRDAVEAVQEIHVSGILEKASDDLDEKLRELLVQASASSQARIKDVESIEIWCGDDDPVVWQSRTQNALKPPQFMILNSLLDELAKTCVPLLERVGDNGMQETTDKSVAGLYWSRGVGEAVVVLLTRGDLPQETPRLPNWPSTLRLGNEALYRTKRKNLTGGIIKCEGIEPSEFSVPCPRGE